jgi:hypothetical protein
MRTLALLLTIAACGGSSAPADYDCTDLSKRVTQDHRPCTIADGDYEPTMFDNCVFPQEAYCVPDGVTCPDDGWHISCQGTVDEPDHDCTYGGDCTGDGMVSMYDYSQALDGVQGMSVVSDFTRNRCVFVECE